MKIDLINDKLHTILQLSIFKDNCLTEKKSCRIKTIPFIYGSDI